MNLAWAEGVVDSLGSPLRPELAPAKLMLYEQPPGFWNGTEREGDMTKW